MDLMSSKEEECERCLSRTMRYDFKSGLFKCFQSKCGFIKSLTVITYEDETISYEDGAKTRNEQLNGRRYIYGVGSTTTDSADFTQFDPPDNKHRTGGTSQAALATRSRPPRTQIDDIGDRIQKEVNACKRIIKKWLDFCDDKKILFEIIENFQELVNFDTHCTVPSVKRKAASSFCYIMAKQLGPSVDLERIAEHTGVLLSDIIKEQEKINSFKFPNSWQTNQLDDVLTSISTCTPSHSNNKQEQKKKKDSTSTEWSQLCLLYLEKIFAAKIEEKACWMVRPAPTPKLTYPQHRGAIIERKPAFMDVLSEQEANVFLGMERNIRALNPAKTKYEKNKITASMVLVFCQLTVRKEFQFTQMLVFAEALGVVEGTVLKYYHKILYPHREQILASIQWENRKSISSLLQL